MVGVAPLRSRVCPGLPLSLCESGDKTPLPQIPSIQPLPFQSAARTMRGCPVVSHWEASLNSSSRGCRGAWGTFIRLEEGGKHDHGRKSTGRDLEAGFLPSTGC